MYNPVSTYRLQFHKEFTFKDCKKILPYLIDLGVTTIYASPVFESTPGSNHGYDVVNPHRINPEIGTMQELEEISTELKVHGIGWLQDIVPNHMAFHTNNNWLMDVLENGQQSRFARFFDILWQVPGFDNKLMVPFLGSPLPELVANGGIQLVWFDKGLYLQYAEQRYPVNKDTYFRLIRLTSDGMPAELEMLRKEKVSNDVKADLLAVMNKPDVQRCINDGIAQINGNPEVLLKVTEEQNYRLCFWKETDQVINYRRFFTVNGLICLNIQDEEVFVHYHEFIKELLDKGIVQGLRVDHIDGLFDPAGYLSRLRQMAGSETYIVVEKILKTGEQFPQDWPVEGNTGYDFLALVNNLLTSGDSKNQFTDFYRRNIESGKSINKAIHEKKSAILHGQMVGELEYLYQLFVSLNLVPEKQIERTRPDRIKAVIGEFLIYCPVYRLYGNQMPLSKTELAAVKSILAAVKAAKPELSEAASLLARVFTRDRGSVGMRAAVLKIYQRCMQFTGPLMAKGVEDTLMYTYERFVGHNEVGDSPAEFGLKINEFHRMMAERQRRWPMSINATSTHDTKRGEDVRAKLNVLTDIAGEWFQTVEEWLSRYAELKDNEAPDANDAYLIFQTLAGAHPLPGEPEDNFSERLADYLTKALREGKVHSQWSEPDEKYEKATLAFAAKLFDSRENFKESLEHLQETIADRFIANSLVQMLLKFSCPGMPDIYQGCEMWDFSLVDPDNRRPVDYEVRSQELTAIRKYNLAALWENRSNGSIKLWLTDKLLHERARNSELFTHGVYLPLQVKGKYKNNIIAFARSYQRNWLIIVASLHLGQITEQPVGFDWDDTVVVLPEEAPLQWKASLTGEDLLFADRISVTQIFSSLPLCMLRSDAQVKRNAGIIMHITSLPSSYGTGDMGPAARKFADFLAEGYQRYWQLLPVTPTAETTGYSPYSSSSSMAGNILMVSPDDLVADGLLDADAVTRYYLPESEKVDFESASTLKLQLFKMAYDRFNSEATLEQVAAYDRFKTDESFWLHDFALYETLKSFHHHLPWYEWESAFKNRDLKTLKSFSKNHQEEIDYAKWLQFIFLKQWKSLKAYGNRLGILFFGDLPFYVNYDSADAWTHPEIFCLDEDKNMAGVAGVPPDYFNASGQLWGMPVYRWDSLESVGYHWWIQRMKKNREFFDVIRLDHFRAFYDYWEVPATESTAVNGSWKPGPGKKIFDAFKEAIGELPFIAEDLGDISPGVYELRDQIGLAGMNLLQYAFGGDMPVSVHIPHNHVLNSVTYTGTHDNNTTVGWFKNDATAIEKKHLNAYLRRNVNARNVNDLLIALCYASVARMAMLPIQDVLSLDADARMNRPASKEGNWLWRLRSTQLNREISARLRRFVKQYNR